MRLFERIKDYILPYFLALLLCTSMFEIYDDKFFTIYNLASAVIILAVFCFLKFWRKHMLVGTFIYFIMAVSAVSLMLRFAYAGDWGASYSKWFLSGGEEAKFQTRYFLAFLSAFPFFFGTIVYYFSNVLYRTSFLMLSSLIPCALYVKVLSDMNDTYLVFIVGLNAAIYAVNMHKKRTLDSKHYGDKAYMLSIAVIVSASLVISSIMPKQGEAIYYDKFEKYFMNAGTGQGDNFTDLSEHSGNADKYRELSYTVLYDVNAPDLLYFRRQNFDIYESDSHCFYPLKKYSSAYSSSADEKKLLNLDDLLKAMKHGNVLDNSIKINNKLKLLDKINDTPTTANISPASGHEANYLITSERTFAVNTHFSDDNLRFTRHGQAFMENDKISDSNGSFSIEYYNENNLYDEWFENGGADFTDDDYIEYIEKLKQVLNENNFSDYYMTANAFENEFKNAMEYKSDYSFNNSEIPDDIAQLAVRITANCKYDWEKAKAIEEYFRSGDYTYDLEYIPPKDMNTVSYFVFTSKKGTCSDFATAYTLMARSVGLTVRYTEGFYHGYMNGANTYTILKKDAHAYPEVYIQNTGWVVFEPTISSTNISRFNVPQANEVSNTNFNIRIDSDILFAVIRIICIIMAIVSAVILFVPFAVKIYDDFRIRRRGADGVLTAYRRINSLAEKRLNIHAKALTPRELCKELLINTGIDISEFIKIYENICFGGAVPDKLQSEFVYSTFRETYRRIRKIKK